MPPFAAAQLLTPLLCVLLLGILTGCHRHQDHFPLRNPQTGQQVICYSGEYWLEEGGPQIRVAEQCMQACPRYGFKRQTGNPYADNILPKAPDEDVKKDIPSACLP